MPITAGLRILSAGAQIVLGAILMAGLMLVLSRSFSSAQRRLPPGWLIIRPPAEVCCLVECGAEIWAGGKDGLTIVERATGTVMPVPAGAPAFGYVRALLLDRQQRLWVAHDSGLAVYSAGRWRTFLPPELPFRRALSLLEDDTGRLWIGGDRLVAVYDGQAFKGVPQPDGYVVASADALYQDSRGTVWVGCASPTYGGLYRLEHSQWHRYGVHDGLPHPAVNMILEDRQQALWIATGFADSGGAVQIKDGQWRQWTKRDGLAGRKVRSVYEDQRGRLWFGSEYDGVAIMDGDRWRVIAPDDGLAGREVKVVLEDSAGVFWLGTENGLNRVPAL